MWIAHVYEVLHGLGEVERGPNSSWLQGRYLTFIHAYALVSGRPPAEAAFQRFFAVTPPSVHNMIKELE